MAKNRTLIFVAAALLSFLQDGTVRAEKKSGAGAEAAAHNDKGVQLVQAGANAEAIPEFTKAIELNPKEFRIYNNRAKAYRAVQNFPGALADFSKAIELAPKDYNAYSERGATLVSQNQLDPGMVDLNKALELKPNDALTLERRGLAFYKQKNYEASLADLNNAIAQNPTSTMGLNRRADTYVAMNQLENAVPDLEAVLKLNPNDFSAEDRLSNVRSRLGKLSVAAQPEAAKPPPTPVPKAKLLTRANILLALGGLLLLAIVGVFIGKLMITRET